MPSASSKTQMDGVVVRKGTRDRRGRHEARWDEKEDEGQSREKASFCVRKTGWPTGMR